MSHMLLCEMSRYIFHQDVTVVLRTIDNRTTPAFLPAHIFSDIEQLTLQHTTQYAFS